MKVSGAIVCVPFAIGYVAVVTGSIHSAAGASQVGAVGRELGNLLYQGRQTKRLSTALTQVVRHAVKEIDHSRLERVLRADDEQAARLDELLEHG